MNYTHLSTLKRKEGSKLTHTSTRTRTQTHTEGHVRTCPTRKHDVTAHEIALSPCSEAPEAAKPTQTTNTYRLTRIT